MAISNENLILYLPLDESPGSEKAYDYSSGRNDGAVTGAQFKEGKIGNCAYFGGQGKIVVEKQVVNLTGDFTISALVRGDDSKGGSPTNFFCWVICFPGIDTSLEKQIESSPGVWTHLALVKIGQYVRYYVNGALLDTALISGAITGIRIEQDYYGSNLGRGSVDELQIFDKALTAEDLLTLFDKSSKLDYYIDEINLKDYGIRVESSDGVIDGLKMKSPFSVKWDDEHGETVDLSRPRFDAREITLNCWLRTTGGYMEFANKVTSLISALRKGGTHRLRIDINPTKPLVYEVYCPDGLAIKKRWNKELMIGKFSLVLREPEPVKRVLKHIVITEATKKTTISFKSNRLYNVYWGDMTADYDVGGDDSKTTTIEHTYAKNGDYFIVITGVVEDIKEFKTNAIVVWNEL